MELYFIEFNGEHYQSVFPTEQADLSELHISLDEAFSYMVNECNIDVILITVLSIKSLK